ncbi:MAG: UvrD-helicase domain-containing protein [Bacilli bacterium]|nr:UvrD-helicase domain-containing protein [Bacilli bacterium]
MDIYKNLNERQKEAITTNDQYLRIIAGAGSGKTRVLTTRIAYLIEEIGVPDNRIIGFTFTNKAAEEMSARLKKLLDKENIVARLSTFHAFGARFLREDIGVLNRSRGFIIYDEEDVKTLIRNIAVDRGHEKRGDISKAAIEFIGRQKEKGLDAFEYKPRPFGYTDEKELTEIWREYENRLIAMGCLDFADLINKTIQILEKYPDVRAKWQNRYDHILVDEFQDTNDIQYKLLKLLMRKESSLYVVGDPDQTIYTWRGANEGIIMNMDRDFPGTKTVILDQNYRSTQQILNAANKLIKHNKNRVEKDLFTSNVDGDPVVVHFSERDVDEVKWIFDQIVLMRLNVPGFSYRKVAILMRANYLTLPFEKFFIHKGVPYQIYGGIRFFQRREIKDVLAFLRILVNEKDDVSFERIINIPRRGIGDIALENLKIAALENEYSLMETIRYVQDLKLTTKSKESLSYLLHIVDETRTKLKSKQQNIGVIIRDYITSIGYFDYIDQVEKDEERQETMRANVHVLIEDIVDFEKRYTNATFEDYLENASLHSAQDDVAEGDYITLMTVHMAKGLEYDYVFVSGMIEGVFPNQRAVFEAGHAGEEEERRLCYVAFTRAKKKLFVTANTSYNFAISAGGKVSRFVEEAGLSAPRYKTYNAKYGTPTRPPVTPPKDVPRFNEPDPYDYMSDFPFAVNDIIEHSAFGSGIVTAIFPSQTIIEVKFDNGVVKKLVATHKSITKK